MFLYINLNEMDSVSYFTSNLVDFCLDFKSFHADDGKVVKLVNVKKPLAYW